MLNNYVRIHNKVYSDIEWTEFNPVLLDGEIIYVIIDNEVRMKMGDGETPYIELSFVDENIRKKLEEITQIEVTPEDAGKILGVDERGIIIPLDITLPKPGQFTWSELEGINSDDSVTEYTDSLQLKKPSINDVVSISDINKNSDIIDSKIKEIFEIIDNQNPSIGSTIAANDLGLVQDSLTGFVYPTLKGIRSINGVYLTGTGGGSGSGTTFKLRSTTESSSFSVALGSQVLISYNFVSVDSFDGAPTGKGTASYYLNSNLIMNTSIDQGETVFDCTPYLKDGNNEFTVSVTDAEGTTKSLTWYIECIEIRITSTFDYTIPYDSNITFKYTPYGNIEKTINFILDNVPQDTVTVESSGRQNTIIFNNLKHGLHTLEVYASANINGSYIESEHLKYDIIVITDNSVEPVISMNYNVNKILQGEMVEIPYIVYDPLATKSTVTLSIYNKQDNSFVLYSEEIREVDRSVQYWRTRNYPLGDNKFVISLRGINRSVEFNVEENSLPISPTTNDLELYLTSANRSNSELNPATWDYNNITTDFNNVNWSSSGWIADESGDMALRLTGGSTATINFKPFSTDLRVYGKTIEFDFAIRDVNNRDASVISCKNGNIGIEITADKARLSSNLSNIDCHFHDERRLRVSFVIESRSEYRLMSVYLNGVLTSAKQYVATDNFQQSNPANIIIGSPFCAIDLYTVRVYNTALNQEEVINNYICDITDIIKRTETFDKNDLYDSSRNLVYEKVKKKIPVMTITGSLPASKGDKKSVVINYEDYQDSSMNFSNLPCTIDVQGTSSQWYVRKNYKLKFKEKITHVKDAIPTKVFCIKADYAEATGTHNTQNANLIHTLYSDSTPAQEDDPRCRTTILGFPIVVYHKIDEDSTPTFLGKYNFNYDKGSEEAFGFTENYDAECWEFCNNTSDACNFTGNIPDEYSMTDENNNEVGWVNDFERRYPDNDDEMNEDAIARFRLVHDWVVESNKYNLSDENDLNTYRTEFEERFNLHKCLIYYVWTFFMLMVDQRAKNMFLTYWGETGKWEPWFYDNDTCLGINNEGQMVFDYYHEDTDFMEDGTKVYNGQDSVLWNQFRLAYASEIQETYRELRSNEKLSFDNLCNYFITNGSEQWAECIYNEDADYKYISMLRENGDATNIPQIKGTGEQHFEYFVEGRLNYCDSKWYAPDYANDFVVLRVNTPTTYESVVPNANITVTPFSDMYAGVRYRANGTLQQERVKKNEPYTFIAPAENFNDTETAIYGASQISSLGDLSPLYSNYCDVSKATKLIELKIGNEDPTYQSRLTKLTLGTNRLLKKLDVRNCKSLSDPINLSGCPNIEEIYAEGSSISSLQLADSGYLKIVHLPETINTLTIKNQRFIEDFSISSYSNITELNLENSVNLPITNLILDSKENNEEEKMRVRLININWSCSAQELSDIYDKLIACGGIDENNTNTSKAVVSGIVRVPEISEELLRKINIDFPELMISVNGTILCTVSYYNHDGTLLYVTTVEQGSDAPDIVEEGIIDTPIRENTVEYAYEYIGWSDSLKNIQKSKAFSAMYFASYGVSFYRDDELLYLTYVNSGDAVRDPISTGKIEIPTKESTAQYHFTFDKWDKNFNYITEPTKINAVFLEILRSYKISFYNEDMLLEEKILNYGVLPSYEKTPEKLNVEYPQDYKFLGWIPELSEVTGEQQYYAQFAESDHILDNWETIAANVENGTYKELYPLGSLKRAILTYPDGTIEEAHLEVVGYDHDKLSGENNTAGLTFICKNILKDTYIMSEEDKLNHAGWENSAMRTYLTDNIYPALEEGLKKVIKPVLKKTSIGGGSDDLSKVVTTVDSIWIPSLVEIINSYSLTPIYAAEGNTYNHYFGNDEDTKKRRIKIDTLGNPQRYWTRTPVVYSTNEYWAISTLGGGISLYTSYAKRGVAFGLCIGSTPK